MSPNYIRKNPEDLDCGLNVFTKVLGGKWKLCILDAISRGYQRPTELHKEIPSATPRVLDMQLRELEQYGMVSKEVHIGYPLRVDYSLTEAGKAVLPILGVIDKWGTENKERIKAIDCNAVEFYTE
jgi:DNA-binding HxlR family transcriptional regulator